MNDSIRESYLQSIEEQERKLNEDKKRLTEFRQFYNKCLNISSNEDSVLLDLVAKLVSDREGEEYIAYKFSFTAPGHYETRYRSPYEGYPGVSGAELAATSEPYDVWINDETESKTILVKKGTAEMFSQLSFSKMRDYFASLDAILRNQKHFCVPSIIKLGSFDNGFDYVNDYLSKLVDWRLKNKTLDIPEEVMLSLLSIPDNESEMRLTMTNPNQE